MAGPEISRDYLPQFERYLRETGVSERHAEFFRHVFVELGAFLDGHVVEAAPAALEAFLAAKIDAGLSERRQRAYQLVLDHIRDFQSSMRVSRRASSGGLARASSDALDSRDILQSGLGFHAAAMLDDDEPAEMPGESTRAINDAPLLARSAMAAASHAEASARKRSVFDPSSRPSSGRHQRLASLDHGRYEESDGFYDRLAGDRSSTAIPDFMDASAGAAADEDLFDPLLDDDAGEGELSTFDGDLPVERLYAQAARAEQPRFDDDLPAVSRGSELPAPRGGRGRGSVGDATPVPRPAARAQRLASLSDDDDDALLPAASKEKTRIPAPSAAPWASGSSTREVGFLDDDLPRSRGAAGDDLPGLFLDDDLPGLRHDDDLLPGLRDLSPLDRPDSEATRVARAVSAPRGPLTGARTPPKPSTAVRAADPLGLFADLDDEPQARPDPLNPRPGVPLGPPSALLSASPASDPIPRNPAALFQASANAPVDNPFGARGATLASHHTPAAAGFERGSTMKGVGAVPKKGADPAPPPSRPVTAPPVGGAVAFSKLGLLEPSDQPGHIEVADDDEAPPAAAAAAASRASSGPSLRAVDVPTDAVRNAKPMPGAETISREDAMRRARKRLSKTLEKTADAPEASRGRGKRFRPFVYDGRFLVDRPAPRAEGCRPVEPGAERAVGSVFKLALVPLLLSISGLALLCLGLMAGLGLGPLAALGVAGWALAAIGAVLGLVIGIPTARWLALGLRALERHTPDAALRAYHEALWVGNYALARRCLALGPDAPEIPEDFDVRQKRCIEEAFNRLDATSFARYWFIQHPQARASGLKVFFQRGRPADMGESRLVAGAVDSGAVLLLVEMRDGQHYWLVPMVRFAGLWYLADGQLFWREITDAKSA